MSLREREETPVFRYAREVIPIFNCHRVKVWRTDPRNDISGRTVTNGDALHMTKSARRDSRFIKLEGVLKTRAKGAREHAKISYRSGRCKMQEVLEVGGVDHDSGEMDCMKSKGRNPVLGCRRYRPTM